MILMGGKERAGRGGKARPSHNSAVGEERMQHVGHFIAGELFPADSGSQIFNPSNGKPTSIAAIGTSAEVDRAVAAARAAFPAWSAQGLQNRATVMLELRAALRNARDELVDIVVAELG